ncbi:MAG: MBL fold metallo-hydrolase [Rhodobacteraceae bacterium]|nr:MBL fold metallo-hydrolase [Paracoccaceae bacterium]MCC0071028.1 MBL fold metallo-hydrolase [Paracoccaceae bacterium]
MKLTVLGAAREVTGSSYLVVTDTVRFLLDCGMVQGGARDAAARNRQPFAFNPRSLDFVLLTHAHIDHSGLLPKLTKDGFGGPILTTSATADLLDVMLRDSAHIQETDAERAAPGRLGPGRWGSTSRCRTNSCPIPSSLRTSPSVSVTSPSARCISPCGPGPWSPSRVATARWTRCSKSWRWSRPAR